jgi:ABC-type Fe3+-citrate transport system substrate-binding protein
MENQRVNDELTGIKGELSIREDFSQKKQGEEQGEMINKVKEYKKQIEELNQEVKEIKEQLSSTQDLIYRGISALFIVNGIVASMIGGQIGNLGIGIIGVVSTIAGCCMSLMSLSNYKTKNESKKKEKQ